MLPHRRVLGTKHYTYLRQVPNNGSTSFSLPHVFFTSFRNFEKLIGLIPSGFRRELKGDPLLSSNVAVRKVGDDLDIASWGQRVN